MSPGPGKKRSAPEADMRRIDAREAKLRLAYERAGGAAGTTMRAILAFFVEYHDKPRPHLFSDVLARITDLNLMALPEHRFGIAGAITGVLSLLPAKDAAALISTTFNATPYKSLIESASRLAIPNEDVLDLRPGHVTFLWSRWLVQRVDAMLNRVIRLSTMHPNAEVRTEASMLLRAHATLPAVAERLQAIQMLLVTPEQQSAAMSSSRRKVSELSELLVKAGGLQQVVLVGWMAGEKGGFLVVTTDGAKPPGCPDTWDQRPVRLRKATKDEAESHSAILNAMEEP